LLSLIHVLEWRAAIHPGAIALSDQQGAELTYAGLAAAVERSAAGFAAAGIAPGDVVPVIARNQAGWVTAMLGLIRAGALPAAVNWRLAGFDPAGFVDELVRRRIQLTQLVPTLIHAVTQEVSSRAEPPDLSQLTEIVYGASPIRPDLLERAVAVLGCRFRQNYASSETGPLPITSLPPEDHDPARGRLGTAGRPSLGWEVRLGERGEIQVRGAAPLPGYWNDPEATARSLTTDGFYRTGDVGRIGADGYLTIVDRLSDLVITGGENVYPAEVEAVLAAHPAVADVAVIGVPDERWGETVHAVVVLAPGALLAPGGTTPPSPPGNGDAEPGFDTGALVSWARERLAGFKCPTGVTVVAELPRNATGKVLRAALRQPFWADRGRLVS